MASNGQEYYILIYISNITNFLENAKLTRLMVIFVSSGDHVDRWTIRHQTSYHPTMHDDQSQMTHEIER